MTSAVAVIQAPPLPLNAPMPFGAQMTRQADSDEQMTRLWLHGRSEHTQRGYTLEIKRFNVFAGKPLAFVTVGDLQGFSDSLTHLAMSSKARSLTAVKSLLSFAQRIGYIPFNVGAAVPLPKFKKALAERILSEASVHAMIALEVKPRNKTILRTLYGGALRVSELCGLKWRDLQAHEDGGQLTIFGKGGKTRVVRLKESAAPLWASILELRGTAGADDPVFRSQMGGHLDPSQVMRLVRAAAHRAGILQNVSPHWFRHSHASHALDRGCPIHLVAATLGHSNIATTGQYLHARPSDGSARYLSV